MKKRAGMAAWLVVVGCICLALPRGAAADDRWFSPLPSLAQPWSPPCGCCPDDYCRKSLPAPPCVSCRKTCDCYGRKPLPELFCPVAVPCDRCYDAKPLPCPPRCSAPWYRCGP